MLLEDFIFCPEGYIVPENVLFVERCSRVGVAPFGQYLRPSLYVIPAKAGIHSASLPEFGACKLDSRFRGNDTWLVRNAGPNDATASRVGERQNFASVSAPTTDGVQQMGLVTRHASLFLLLGEAVGCILPPSGVKE
jgi:hypothetical protein